MDGFAKDPKIACEEIADVFGMLAEIVDEIPGAERAIIVKTLGIIHQLLAEMTEALKHKARSEKRRKRRAKESE